MGLRFSELQSTLRQSDKSLKTGSFLTVANLLSLKFSLLGLELPRFLFSFLLSLLCQVASYSAASSIFVMLSLQYHGSSRILVHSLFSCMFSNR